MVAQPVVQSGGAPEKPRRQAAESGPAEDPGWQGKEPGEPSQEPRGEAEEPGAFRHAAQGGEEPPRSAIAFQGVGEEGEGHLATTAAQGTAQPVAGKARGEGSGTGICTKARSGYE